jgi:3-oxocholest-4-en-26-oate---CoA ligase
MMRSLTPPTRFANFYYHFPMIAIADFSFSEILAQVASTVPDRPAICWRESCLSYATFTERSYRFGNAIGSRDPGRAVNGGGEERWRSQQDHVAIVMRNRPEWLEAMFGSFAARAVPFNVNYRYVATEMAHVLEVVDPVAIVYEPAFASVLTEAMALTGSKARMFHVDDESGLAPVAGSIPYEGALADAPANPPRTDWAPDDLYALLTGGTTGFPKAVLWRQADIFVVALGGRPLGPGSSSEYGSLAELGERIAPHARSTLAAAPFMHGAAQWGAAGTLLSGDTVVIQDNVDRFDAHDVWSTVERHGVKRLAIVGDAFARPLVAALEKRSYDLGCVRAVVSGGVALSAGCKQALLAALPNASILDTAGASETGPQLIQNTSAGAESATTGTFLPADGTCVLSDDRRSRIAPADRSIGWLARSGRVPLGYLNEPERTAETFPEVAGVRFSIPGDRARYTADGRIELLGRDSITINSGGEKIFAEEVEQALVLHPDVDDVLVAARPSERWGQEVVAVVQLRPGTTASLAELRTVAAHRIAAYKLPKDVIFVDAIQRSPAGKADYRWAAAIAAAASTAA